VRPNVFECIEAFKHPDRDEWQRAVRELWRMGIKARSAVPALLGAMRLNAEDEDIRLAAACQNSPTL